MSAASRKIIAVDNLTRADKFRNLVDCDIADYLDKQEFLDRLQAGDFDGDVDAIFHQGACSDTIESDGRYMMENNYRYSMALLDWCMDQDVQLLYASSAATYGGGGVFRKSDRTRRRSTCTATQSSSSTRSSVSAWRSPARSTRRSSAFATSTSMVRESRTRDAWLRWRFIITISSAARARSGCFGVVMVMAMASSDAISSMSATSPRSTCFSSIIPRKSGIFNVGTGRAQTFNELAMATVNGCRALAGDAALPLGELVEQGLIEYIPFPDDLRGKYQSFTEADLSKLRKAGYDAPFAGVEKVSRSTWNG
jgi:ADP-L-glycero-D-manno-heptose 6-epimerase